MIAFIGTNIMFWNCQGIRSKHKELELYLKENNFDIVALNETFLTKKVDFKIQGYDKIKYDRSAGTRGGVAFLVKHGLVMQVSIWPVTTPGPLIFSVKIPTPGTAFQCKTPALDEKGKQNPHPRGIICLVWIDVNEKGT